MTGGCPGKLARQVGRGRWAGGAIVGAGGCNLHPTPPMDTELQKYLTTTEIDSSNSY